jgi:TolA-binding protein
MTETRRSLLRLLAGLAAAAAAPATAFAQAGYAPPMPGQAPPSFGDGARFHEEQQRQQQIQRQQFDDVQRGQQRDSQRNLDTLRRQQDQQRRSLDGIRREQLDQERRTTDQRRFQVQGRRVSRRVTDAERDRINAAARRSSRSSTPSILIEDGPPRRRIRGRQR